MAAGRQIRLPSGVRINNGAYQVRYIGPDGKRYSKTFTHLEDAKYWHAVERRLIDQGEWTPPAVREGKQSAAALTLSEWAEQRIQAWSTRSRSPIVGSTVEDYRRAFRLRIEDVLGDVPVSLLTPAKVRSWHEGLPDTPTINGKSYDLLKHLMNDAINDELIATNPCRIVGAGKPRAKGAAEALSVQEIGPYLDAVEDYYRPALAVAVLGGLRSGEIRGLRRRDLDMEQGTVRIAGAIRREQVTEGEYKRTYTDTKTPAGRRVVYLPATVLDYIGPWLETRDFAPDDLLFPARRTRKTMNETVLASAHRRAAKIIGRPTLTLHNLRATAATLAKQAGMTDREVQRRFGHTTAAMANLYQVPELQRDKAGAAMIESLLGRAEYNSKDSDS
ncbi:MAG: site-specific integrase [Arachnia sp.]